MKHNIYKLYHIENHMNEPTLKFLRRGRKGLVEFKYTLQRGYAWLQVPTLGLIGAGVLKPYFPNHSLTELGIAAMILFLIVGYLDRKLKLVHEEQNLVTQLNPTLMKGLYGDKDGRRPKD